MNATFFPELPMTESPLLLTLAVKADIAVRQQRVNRDIFALHAPCPIGVKSGSNHPYLDVRFAPASGQYSSHRARLLRNSIGYGRLNAQSGEFQIEVANLGGPRVILLEKRQCFF